MTANTVDTIRELAIRELGPGVFDHFEGGVDDEATMRENRLGLEKVKLIQRVLAGNGTVSTDCSVLGVQVAQPLLLAPTGHHAEAHPRGELATASAARDAGVPMILSTGSSYSLEEVAETGAHLLFQLFQLADPGIARDLVERAEGAGYRGIVLTVDTQVVGKFRRSGRALDRIGGMREGNLERYGVNHGGLVEMFSSSQTWDYVEWVKNLTKLPVVVKGVQCADDARMAAETGAGAVYVSNHGGRQLDSSPSSIELLDPIVQALGGTVETIVDGGFRSGTDVAKALGLGASAVAVGRPYLYGLAAEGEAGVGRVIEIFRSELQRVVTLMGCTGPHELTRDHLRLTRSFGFLTPNSQ